MLGLRSLAGFRAACICPQVLPLPSPQVLPSTSVPSARLLPPNVCDILSHNYGTASGDARNYGTASGDAAVQKVMPVPEEEREPLKLAASPQDLYDYRVKYRDLSFDVHQQEVTTRFDKLYNKLGPGSYRPQENSSFLESIRSVSPRMAGLWSSSPPKIPKGVYLWGSVGGGKTMLMDMFYDTIEGLDPSIKKHRTHYHDFMQEVHKSIHKAKLKAPPRDTSRWDEHQPFDPIPHVGDAILEKSWLLCLDEFQVTDVADAMILRYLFSYLFDKGLLLVATSNRPPDDLYKSGIQRANFIPFIGMLKDCCNIVSLDPGVDYRRRALQDADKLFFVTSHEDTNGTLKTMFKMLASKEDDMVRERSLRVMNRDIHFAKGCGRLLDATFEELCLRPLWTGDFIAIAHAFHTVFIRDIPVMSQKNKSEARRFIALIDTFYDNKVRVIASGEAEYWNLFQSKSLSKEELVMERRDLMDDLFSHAGPSADTMTAGVFSGEEEAFAFDRTVSRLTEMQTKPYLKKCYNRDTLAAGKRS